MTRLNQNQGHPQLTLPPELQQAMQSGQTVQMQMQQVFLGVVTDTMGKLVSAAYMDALHNGRQQKAYEIKKKIKEEQPYIEEDKLNESIMEELAKNGSFQLNIDLGLLADISIQAGRSLLQKLQVSK